MRSASAHRSDRRSATVRGVRQQQYELAVSDIFGTNLFDIALVFVIDAVYGGGSALNEVGEFSTVAALLGAMVTAIFVAGLIERRDRTLWRAGVDSSLVLITYVAGLVLLFRLR
jgi:cation:H+ antiporter